MKISLNYSKKTGLFPLNMLIFTQTSSIYKIIMKKFLTEKLVKDIMSKKIITAAANTPVRKIIDLFASNKVMSIPVVDQENRLQGIITQKDIDIRFENIDTPVSITLLGSVFYLEDLEKFNEALKKKLGQFAVDIMTAPSPAIREDATLDAVLKYMDENTIFRIPVVNESGHLVGMVTNSDIIQELIREGKRI